MKSLFSILAVLITAAIFYGCGNSSNQKKDEGAPPTSMVEEEVDPMENLGIGPIKSLELGVDIDSEMAANGKQYYDQLCSACHKAEEKYIGPSPKGIFDRRSPEWVMNMILNPVEMVKDDPIAKALLIEFNGAPMADQNVTEDQARAILEYFRTL